MLIREKREYITPQFEIIFLKEIKTDSEDWTKNSRDNGGFGPIIIK